MADGLRRGSGRALGATVTSVLAALLTASPLHAASLAELLDDVVTREGLADLNPSVVESLSFVPILTRVAIRSADFPTTSTTPNFVYSFDPTTATFERRERALGSIFLDQPETVGHRIFEIGVSAFYSDASRLDGDDVTGEISRFFVAATNPEPPFNTTTIPIALTFDDFNLRTTGLLLTATYGLTERWDVNLLAPLLWTNLDVQGGQDALLGGGTTLRIERVDIDEGRLGPGDILLRTKYHVGRLLAADFALGFGLRMPTGSEDDFQGLGDWILTPFLAIGRNVGPHNLHFNLGVDTDANVLERTRVRYGVGASIRMIERLSLLIDVFGTSGIADEEFEAGVFQFRTRSGFRDFTILATAPRTDVVDAAFGVKLKLRESVIGFLSAVVPITTDGLRADVVPAGGLQVTF